jgi:predicted DNA-binding transcriptional regulator YafY
VNARTVRRDIDRLRQLGYPVHASRRTFRVDRIAGSRNVGAHFPPRPGPDGGNLRKFVSRSLAVAPYTEQARVILHASREAMARCIPSSAGLLEAIDAQRCLLECGARELDSFVYWLMALDVEFEVLTPPSLVERLRVARRSTHPLSCESRSCRGGKNHRLHGRRATEGCSTDARHSQNAPSAFVGAESAAR